MASELVNIAEQYRGLPMGDLIGAPLTAACDAQIRLAQATANFIETIGFKQGEDGTRGDTRYADFKFKRPTVVADGATTTAAAAGGNFYEEEVQISVPLLALVKVPALSITTVDITFNMEVKSSYTAKEENGRSGTLSAKVGGGFGPFTASVNVSGTISSKSEQTRASDNSAKYTVQVHAEDGGVPEGLARVLDILQSSIAPQKVTAPQLVQ